MNSVPDNLRTMHPSARAIMEVADRVLMEQGELDPFECLLELGFVTNADYTDWRAEKRSDLQSALLVPVDEAAAALALLQSYAMEQGLSTARVPDGGDRLSVGASRRLSELCSCILRRSVEQPQRDLFHDSAQTAAVNALRAALVEGRRHDAQQALHRLSTVSADLHALEDYRRLLGACEPSSALAPERLRELDELAPAAARNLRTQAAGYLSPLWTDLASALEGTPFSPAAPRLHASYAYARARRWDEVARSVEAESDWFRYAALITRLAEAHARVGQPGLARPLWMRLCWEHPGAAYDILTHAPGDPVISRLWREFTDAEAEFEAGDFPAWLLLADSRQSQLVPAESAPDDPHGRAYAALHRVITSGGEMAARRELHALRPDLLRLYLARKESHGI